MSQQPKYRRSNGFTLLELLISMVLFSVLSIALYSSLSLAIKSTASGEKHNQEVTRVLAIAQFLRHKITRAKTTRQGKGSGQLAFEGRAESLDFVADLPQSATLQADVIYSISLLRHAEVGDEPSAVSVALRSLDDKQDDATVIDEQVLVRGIEKISFSYFGSLDDQQQAAWHTDWLEQKKLPLLIKVDLVSYAGLAWPTIVIAPLAATRG